jgi:D-3-phosphoglycerate dehydrogenase
MKIVIPDDYQDAVRGLDCFDKLAGHEVTVFHDTVKDVETLAARFQDADALVLIRERTAISEALLARLPKLKFISQTGRGIPHIDVPACTRHGVAVANTSGSPHAPAELTWGLVMAGMLRIPQAVTGMKVGRWQTTFGLGLRGRTLGILGYGNIGTLVAGYGRAFGMNVLVWGREGSLSRAREDGFGIAASQRALFEQSDVVSVHLKLTQDTRGIVTAADLAAMKPTALLVNTSRGELIESGALEKALRAGRPGYAAMDVYESEPIIDDPLLHMHNVICTPHIGYVEKDSYEHYFGEAFDHLLALAEGKLVTLVNPEALGR